MCPVMLSGLQGGDDSVMTLGGDVNPPLLSGLVTPQWGWMPSLTGSGGKGMKTDWSTFREGLGLQRQDVTEESLRQ